MNLIISAICLVVVVTAFREFRLAITSRGYWSPIWIAWGIWTIGAPLVLELFALSWALPSGLLDLVIICGNLFICLAIRSEGLKIDLTIGLTTVLVAIAIVTGFATNALTAPAAELLNLLPVLLIPASQISLSAFKQAFLGVAIFVFSSLGALAALAPQLILGACRLDKCSVWGLAIGNYGSGNSLGLYFAFASICVVTFSASRLTKLASAVTGLVVVDLCVSRSALAAYITALAIVFIKKTLTRRAWLGLFPMTGVVFIGVLVPTLALNGGEFTERAALWASALEEIGKSPVVGYGPSAWVRQGTVEGTFTNYSIHNIWLEHAYALGVVGALIFCVLMVGWRLDTTVTSHILLSVSVFYLALGVLEVPAGFTRPFVVPEILTVLLLVQRLHRDMQGSVART